MTFSEYMENVDEGFDDISQRVYSSFKKFHQENPDIYQLFKDLAYEARKSFKRFGAKAIWEVLRWETRIKTGTDYKLNNNYTAAYTRLLIKEDQSFKDFFSIRKHH